MQYLRKIIAVALLGGLTVVPAIASAAATTSLVAVKQSSNAHQQVNTITAFIDGSMIYGSDNERANMLRTFQGGRLKTSTGNLMPMNSTGMPNANDAHLYPDTDLFLAGDVRANENVELTAVHALWLREHNRIADELAKQNAKWTDEQIYLQARKIVIAELQVITYKEFLPALLGSSALKPYTGYKSYVNPGIANEFSTAAFRIGHTLINDDVEFLDNDGNAMRDEMPLAEAFFNPSPLHEFGPDPVLKYLATDNAQEVDTEIIDGLRNFLFGPPGAGGLDLASLNIQRGRDHGIADYNSARAAYGLPKVTTFAQVTSNTALQQKLKDLYGNVNNIDLWVGGLAEDHVSGGSVGPTFKKIIADQFERLRDGDRFWYQRTFSGETLQDLEGTRLKDVLERNTVLTDLQDNVFYFTGESDEDARVAATALTKDASATTEKVKQTKLTKWRNLIGLFAKYFQKVSTESIDGSNNNLLHPLWGKVGEALLRKAPSAYGDGVSTPAGANRPSPRVISNTIAAHDEDVPQNNRNLSDWVYAWGQFIDHDMDLTTQGTEAFDIKVPKGDQWFDPLLSGTQIIPFTRSNYDPAKAKWTKDTSKKNPNPLRRVFPSLQ